MLVRNINRALNVYGPDHIDIDLKAQLKKKRALRESYFIQLPNISLKITYDQETVPV